MAYIEPKTNWVASNAPGPSDFNRIEGNAKQNHDDIAAEAVARDVAIGVEAAARIADVDSEESARIAADLVKAPIPKTSSGAGRFAVITATGGTPFWGITFPESGTWLVLNTGIISSESAINVSSSGNYMCWRIA